MMPAENSNMNEATTGSRAQSIIRDMRLVVFLLSLPFGMLWFMLPVVGRDMGASAVEIGGLYSVFSLMTVLLRPVVGRAIDHFGRRPFFLVGTASYAVGNLAYAAATNVAGLYAARIAQGVGSGLTWLAAYSMVSDLAGGLERGGRFGQIDEMASRGGIVGIAVAFALMGYLGESAGWSASFYLYTAVGLLALAIAARRVPETAPARRAIPQEAGQPIPWSQRWRRYGALFHTSFTTLMGIVLLTASAYALTSPILILFLRDHITSSITYIALAFAPSALIYAFLPSRLGRISDRFGRRLPMGIALAVGGVVALAIPHLRSIWPLIMLWIAESVCFAGATPAEEALVADLSEPEARGLAYGIYTGTYSLGSVIGPLLGGWVYERCGEATPFFIAAGMLWLGALLIFRVLKVPAPAGRTVSETNATGA